MKPTETAPGIPPDLAAELREALDDLADTVARLVQLAVLPAVLNMNS